eukprot:s373_g44.t1
MLSGTSDDGNAVQIRTVCAEFCGQSSAILHHFASFCITLPRQKGCTDIFVHSHHCVGGFIPTPGDVLEFELEKGKKKDGTINFTAINVPAMGPKPAQNIVPLGIKRMMGKVRHGDPTAFGE